MPSIIMNQQVILNRASKPNKYAEFTYDKEYIKCRLEMKQVIFKTADGKEHMSRGILYTKSNVKLEDKISYGDTAYTCAAVYDTIDLMGVLQFHKVYLL